MLYTPSWTDILQDAQEVLQELDRFVITNNTTQDVRADHLGFKCSTTAEFEAMRTLLEGRSAFLYQSIISQRRIAICRLTIPLQSACGPIEYIELSDQKPDLSQLRGFDHVEVYPSDGNVPRIVAALEARGIAIASSHRPHHMTFDTRLTEQFMLRIEQEPLITKIKNTEMH